MMSYKIRHPGRHSQTDLEWLGIYWEKMKNLAGCIMLPMQARTQPNHSFDDNGTVPVGIASSDALALPTLTQQPCALVESYGAYYERRSEVGACSSLLKILKPSDWRS
jgi:hypothetical protein